MKYTKEKLMALTSVHHKQKNTEVSYKILDGEMLNQIYPETFFIPPRQVRENIPLGTDVKLVFDIHAEHVDCAERMWVTVTDKSGDHYVGQLNNNPLCTKKLKAGAEIIFRTENIIDIFGS